MVPIACPPSEQLQQLVQGRLPVAQARALARHVNECPTCARTVAALKTKLRLGQIPQPAAEGARPAVPGKGRPPAQAPQANADVSEVPTLTPAVPPAAEEPTEVASAPENSIDYSFLAPPREPGELGRLGGYRVLKVLGQGGMGIVFEAEDVHLQRSIALKAMLPEAAAKPSARERFLREARAAAKLNHDNVVSIHQVGEDRGVPFIAMPLLKGASLEAFLRARERKQPGPVLRLGQILKVSREIARGLAAAHARGLVHRDIKPANIWLDATVGGRVKILDFGLARPTEGEQTLTRTGAIVGTPSYMAPEQGQGQTVDARTDLFSLGVVMYRLCTGQLPFRGEDMVGTLLAVVTHDPPPPLALNPDLPPALSDLVIQLLAKDPNQRPASARDVAKTLQTMEKQLLVRGVRDAAEPDVLLLDEPERQAIPAGRRQRAPVDVVEHRRGKGFLVGALVLVLLLGLAGAAYFLAGNLWTGTAATGTLVIVNEFPEVTLTILKDGTVIQDKVRDRELELPAGTYTLALSGDKDGLQVSPNPIVLPAGGQETVRVAVDKSKTPPPAVAPFDATAARAYQKGWARYLGTPVVTTNTIGMKLVLIPPGEFQMGWTEAEIQNLLRKFPGKTKEDLLRLAAPQHQVKLTRPYLLGVHEVTVGQFRQFVQETSFRTQAETSGKGTSVYNPVVKRWELSPTANWRNPGFPQSDKHPVTGLTWNDVAVFCDWLSRKEGRTYRLPTEAEWEFACRAGTTTFTPYGPEVTNQQAVVNYGGTGRTEPVGLKVPNNFGLYDMIGNAWEWVADYYGPYTAAGQTDPLGPPTGAERVLRGLAFDSIVNGSAYRLKRPPTLRSVTFGFRVVCQPDSLPPPGFVSLFNGKDLTGWKVNPQLPGDWQVHNGVLVGRGPKNSYLFTERDDFTDFHLRVEAKLSAIGDSGVFFRCGDSLGLKGTARRGYEAQITLGKTSLLRTGSLINPVGPNIPVSSDLIQPGQWFTVEVIAHKNHLVTRVNGQPAVDMIDPLACYARGRLALQVYHPETVVSFRKIAIKELTEVTASGPATVNLLPLIDPKVDQVEGAWRVNEAGALVCSGGTPLLQVPYRPPQEYDLHLDLERRGGSEGLNVILVSGGRQFHFVLGANANKVAGFQIVGGKGYKDNATTVTTDAWLAVGERRQLVVQVRKNGALAYLDGDPIAQLQGDYKDMTLPLAHRLPDPGALGLLTWSSPFDFYRIEVKEISTPGTFLRPNDPAAKMARGPSGRRLRPPLAVVPFTEDQAKAHQQAWSKYLGLPVTFKNSAHLNLTLVPAGQFLMGSPVEEIDRKSNETQHEVVLTRPFYIGTHEVTVDQFRQFVNETEYETDAEKKGGAVRFFGGTNWRLDPKANWLNPGYDQTGDFPVVCVSWNDAQAFCTWLSQKEGKKYSLPTEAQWEFACRAGTEGRYSFADDPKEIFQHAWVASNSGMKAHPSGLKKPNAFGLMDMHGNVWEWVADWYKADYYKQSPLNKDPKGPATGTTRVERGGSWYHPIREARSASRWGNDTPDFRDAHTGFRVVCAVDGP